MMSRAFSLYSTAWIATYRSQRHQMSGVARQRLAQLIVGAGFMSFAALVKRFLLFPPLCVSSKSAL